MKRLIILLKLCLLSFIVNSAIKVDVSPKTLSLGENVRLTLIIDSATKVGSPNLMPLLKDFEVLGTERSYSFSDTNGNLTSIAQWTLILRPKHAGKINIPPITIGNERSDPLVINVGGGNPAPKAAYNDSKYTIITAEANEKNPFINQQVVYTVKLYNRQQLFDAQYKAPEVENALIIPLGDGKSYQTSYLGNLYNVEEISYAIFPQKTGTFVIKPPEFTAEVIDGFNPTRINISTKRITLNVQKLKDDININEWLAAEDVKLSENYANSSTTYIAGDTIIRHVKLEAVGMVAQLLPKLNFNSNECYNVYVSKPQIENNLVNGKIVASANYKVTYLLTKAQNTTLPAINLPWYNINTKSNQQASLPARQINVTPSAAKQIQGIEHTAENHRSELLKSRFWYWYISWFAVILVVLALISIYVIKRQRKKSVEAKINSSLARIKKACKRNDPVATRQAILVFARQQWPNEKILNLNNIPIKNHEFKAEIKTLAQAIFAKDSTTWNGQKFWDVFIKLKFNKSRKKSKTNLPPIYLN